MVMAKPHYELSSGDWNQGGATPQPEGVNFCVFTRFAERVELLLFDRPDSEAPFQVVDLDPGANRTFFFWHVFVKGLPSGTYYCWRVDGPSDIEQTGCRFNPNKALIDPWATTVDDRLWDRQQAKGPADNIASAMRAQVVADDYDWEGDQPLHLRLSLTDLTEYGDAAPEETLSFEVEGEIRR